MRYGFQLPQVGGDVDGPSVARFARRMEALDYHTLWAWHHVVIPREVRTPYPYSPTGEFFPGKMPNFLDNLGLLTFVAAVTEKVRLGTAILNLAYPHPLMLAKAIATMDLLSGGRVTLGVAAGWLKEEFHALGIPYEERVARAEECLRILVEVWTKEEPNFEGRFHRAVGIKCAPRPVQRPHPPILVGGHTRRAFRWIAENGAGWLAPHLPEEKLARLLQELREMVAARGRDPAALEVWASAPLSITDSPVSGERKTFIGSPEQIAQDVFQYRRMGATALRLAPTYGPGRLETSAMLELAERFARDVMPLVA